MMMRRCSFPSDAVAVGRHNYDDGRTTVKVDRRLAAKTRCGNSRSFVVTAVVDTREACHVVFCRHGGGGGAAAAQNADGDNVSRFLRLAQWLSHANCIVERYP